MKTRTVNWRTAVVESGPGPGVDAVTGGAYAAHIIPPNDLLNVSIKRKRELVSVSCQNKQWPATDSQSYIAMAIK